MIRDDGDDASAADTLPSLSGEIGASLLRSGENRLSQWILLTGHRMTVTAGLLFFVFVSLLALGAVRPVDMRSLLNETAAARTLFSSLLGGAILLVSIVVSINSTVLSQEITDIERQEERIGAAIEYHQRIEEFIQRDVSPTQPAEFLTAILHAVSRLTRSLADFADDATDEEFKDDVDTFADEVGDDLRQARRTLRNAQVGSFKVLLAGLNYDYTGQLYASRRLKRKYGDQLDEEETEILDDLVDSLEFFATGREYFKSLYYERELARLSSRLLYVSLPVIVFTSYVILAVDGDVVPEMRVFRFTTLQIFVSFAYTIALAPYVVLTAYVVRLATITLRTLAAGPFVFQRESNVDVFDGDTPENAYEWDLPGENE